MSAEQFFGIVLDWLTLAGLVILILIVLPWHLGDQPSKRKRKRPKFAVRLVA